MKTTEEEAQFDWDSAKQVGETQEIKIPFSNQTICRKLFKDKNGLLMGEDSMTITAYTKPVNTTPSQDQN